MSKIFRYLVASLALTIIQTQLMRYISLQGVTPDLLTIWIVYLAISNGQLSGLLWGFGIGLVADFVTGNFIGLFALTKTVAGFVAGYFYNENKTQMTLGSYRFILIVLFVSLIHDIVYFIMFTQGMEIGLLRAVFEFGIVTSLYTAVVALVPMMIYSRRRAH